MRISRFTFPFILLAMLAACTQNQFTPAATPKPAAAPAAAAPVADDTVKLANIHLITSEADMSQRTTPQDLANYLHAVQQAAQPVMQQSKVRVVALAQFNCMPAKCQVNLASPVSTDKALLQRLYDVLNALPPLKTTGEAVFQAELGVH